MNKINEQSRDRLMDSENRLTAVRGEEIGGWVRKVKGLSKEKKERLMDTDNSLVITRGKGDYGRGRRGYGKTHGDGRRLHLGW